MDPERTAINCPFGLKTTAFRSLENSSNISSRFSPVAESISSSVFRDDVTIINLEDDPRADDLLANIDEIRVEIEVEADRNVKGYIEGDLSGHRRGSPRRLQREGCHRRRAGSVHHRPHQGHSYEHRRSPLYRQSEPKGRRHHDQPVVAKSHDRRKSDEQHVEEPQADWDTKSQHAKVLQCSAGEVPAGSNEQKERQGVTSPRIGRHLSAARSRNGLTLIVPSD